MERNTFLTTQIRELRDALTLIEAELHSGNSCRAALEDFKATVDNLRATISAVMETSENLDFEEVMADFHIRRATLLAQSVLSDAVLGTIPNDLDGWYELQHLARMTLGQLDAQNPQESSTYDN